MEWFDKPAEIHNLHQLWLKGCGHAIGCAEALSLNGLHKQWANRVIEPWMNITVLITATEWLNFFKLRAHPEAHPDFQVLAYRMLDRYLKSEPKLVKRDGWHIPFGDKMPEDLSHLDRIAVAIARAARLSYLTFDGEMNVNKDIELYQKLKVSGHWSPFEHVAQADPGVRSGNFIGWRQYRKTLPREDGTDGVDLNEIMSKKPDWIEL